ncbi:unnamed protein product [Chrysoparadoxa australica]
MKSLALAAVAVASTWLCDSFILKPGILKLPRQLSPTPPQRSPVQPSIVTTFSAKDEVIDIPSGAGDVADIKADLLDACFPEVGYYPKNAENANDVKRLVASLEAASSTDVRFPDSFPTLNGRWKLLYSSSITSITRISPLRLDEVYQVIDTDNNSVRNIVYGTVRPPLFKEVWSKFPIESVQNAIVGIGDRVSFGIEFTLDHSLEISSESSPAELKVAIKEVTFNNNEQEGRKLTLPTIQLLAKALSGRFETTYLDDDLRISRGSFGELRVFQRSDMPYGAVPSEATSAGWPDGNGAAGWEE